MPLSRAIRFILFSSTVGFLISGCNEEDFVNKNKDKGKDKLEKLCIIPNANPDFIDNYSDIDLSIKSPLFKYNEAEKNYNVTQPVTQFWSQLDSTAPQIEIPDNYKTKKQQIRSTWIATIANLTMPKSDSPESFKAQFDEYVQTHEDFNMNALIFQIRPLLDAFYPSEINPTSEFLSSGRQGENLWDLNEFDPLKYMIEKTHEKGMEFHAWFNPYRVTNTKLSVLFKGTEFENTPISIDNIPEIIDNLASLGILAENNFAVLNPTEVYLFDEKLFLNPSSDLVIDHVAQTVNEVITKYDVDAIHFDDYFYPYKINVNNVPVLFENEDRADFLNRRDPSIHPDNKLGLEAWRRDNITKLITQVKSTIDLHNESTASSVQFGISPFGIWEHKQNNPLGSNTPTGSSQSYTNSIYADTKLWIEQGYLDYVLPQIYWSFEENAAPYGELAIWWNDVIGNAIELNNSPTKTQLYIGHANYKHYANSWESDWANPEEIPNQIRFNQSLDHADGSVYFSYNELIKKDPSKVGEPKPARVEVRNSSIDLIKDTYSSVPVLPPSKPWLDHKETLAPQKAFFIDESSNSKTLDSIIWSDTPENDSRYYVIYRGLGDPNSIFANPANIIAKVWRGDKNEFTKTFDNPEGEQYTYLISAVDAAQMESQYSQVKANKKLADSKGLTCE